MKGQALAPIGSLKRMGVVAITDDGECVQSNELMRRACEYAKMFDLPLMDHCQDASLTHGAVMNEGKVSTRLGLRGWPHAAEDIIVARNVILSEHTGAHIHLQHISSRFSVDIIRRAKQRGARITAEATPHHIALTDESLSGYDTNFKMNPPLRTEADRVALIAGLRDGTLDCVSTDHAPHTDYEKDKEFDFRPQRYPRAGDLAPHHARNPRPPKQVQTRPRRRPHDAPPRRAHAPPRRHAHSRCRRRHLSLRRKRKVALRREERLQQIQQLPLVRPNPHRPRENHNRRRPHRLPRPENPLNGAAVSQPPFPQTRAPCPRLRPSLTPHRRSALSPHMSGIDFLTDKRGRKTAVVINLKLHRQLWEDFHDALLAQRRKPEPRESLATVRQSLIRQGKLGA
jgi:hypothetical protein